MENQDPNLFTTEKLAEGQADYDRDRDIELYELGRYKMLCGKHFKKSSKG